MSIYLDHAASSPIRPQVLESYYRDLAQVGNPASIHSYGQRARAALEQAREDLASVLDCDRNEVIFTSGGTESDNLAIKGLYWQRHGEERNRTLIITSAAEHHAVLDAIDWLVQEQGAEAHYLKLSEEGEIDLDELQALIAQRSQEIALITLMWANNEIGNISPIAKVTELAKPFGIPVHSDAIAAFGHIPISFRASSLSAMSITGHKIGAPVGIGAVIVSRSIKLTPVLHGGGHERRLRSGTPDASAALAFAKAARLAAEELDAMREKHESFSALVVEQIKKLVPDAVVSAQRSDRLPNNVHFRFPGCLGDSLLFLLDRAGVSVSTGSACTAGVAGPSHVVMALGATKDEAMGTLRLSFGHSTEQSDIDAFLAAFPAAYEGAKKAGLTRK